MHLDRVTITGADDSVDPRSLNEISQRYPFVEWGILFSAKREGLPRYPSRVWVEKLKEVQLHRERVGLHPMKLSAHLCGRYVRDFVVNGQLTFADRYQLSLFQRVQLNFHAEPHESHPAFESTVRLLDNYEWIFQHDGINDGLLEIFKDEPERRVYPLFDRSGGAGVVPDDWPRPIRTYQGYAGGLGPDNIVHEIERIQAVAGDARLWIDMETRVRSDDDEKLEMGKVEACLKAAAPFVKGNA